MADGRWLWFVVLGTCAQKSNLRACFFNLFNQNNKRSSRISQPTRTKVVHYVEQDKWSCYCASVRIFTPGSATISKWKKERFSLMKFADVEARRLAIAYRELHMGPLETL
jgi:hypothetical protein